MEIKVLPLGDIGSNSYMIDTEKSAVVIDVGYESDVLTDFLLKNQDKERLILLTHCHFDHVGGAEKLRKLTNTKIGIGEFEASSLLDGNINLSNLFQEPLNPFEADFKYLNNQIITVGDLNFKVIHTPGHTVGGVCYILDNILFSGDTLFDRSIGRTDFPGGSFEVLENSVKMLYELDDDTVVLPGHGDSTTIFNERKHNPFIRG